jgi:hypothetical protein
MITASLAVGLTRLPVSRCQLLEYIFLNAALVRARTNNVVLVQLVMHLFRRLILPLFPMLVFGTCTREESIESNRIEVNRTLALLFVRMGRFIRSFWSGLG